MICWYWKMFIVSHIPYCTNHCYGFSFIVAVSFTAKHRAHCSREREGGEMCYNNIMCDWILCITSPLLLVFFLLMDPSVHFSIVSFLLDQTSTDSLFHYICSLPFDSTPDMDHHHFPHPFLRKIYNAKCEKFKEVIPAFNKWKKVNLCHCGFILSQQIRINWNVKNWL